LTELSEDLPRSTSPTSKITLTCSIQVETALGVVDFGALHKAVLVVTLSPWYRAAMPACQRRLPKQAGFFFIDPGVKAKYSYLASVPDRTSFLNLHASFTYMDQKAFHTAERTIEMSGNTIKSSHAHEHEREFI